MRVKIQSKNGHKIVEINRRKAIRERCLNCTAWSYKRVVDCQYEYCSLHPFRTGEGRQNAKARSKAIRAFCWWCVNESRREVKNCPCIDCSLFVYRRTRIDRQQSILSRKNAVQSDLDGKTNLSLYLSIGQMCLFKFVSVYRKKFLEKISNIG